MNKNDAHIMVAGIKCHKKQPSDTRLAIIDDFHNDGKVKIGMPYFIKSCYSCLYEEYTVSEYLTRVKIKPYVDAGMVLVYN